MDNENPKTETFTPSGVTKETSKYSTETLIGDASWSNGDRAILKVVLKAGEKYSLEDAKAKITNFKEGI
ncbi:hypothetical protein [Apilactobacillus xinyiensis]|uniref:hypothetical protein n=1 Tax=Apilactobacillus xinyiensis TaxID=2841032 RepID=UPI00200C332A|nr:hypothetical protein [Apilactobacillus xinyiensis]MCL0330611.1 hypothetical protein [Apilactobacillus xinyiensis]